MVGLPALTGVELVAALEGLGFRVRTSRSGLSTLVRRASAVVVPEAATLGPILVGALLRAAGVSPDELVAMRALGSTGGAGGTVSARVASDQATTRSVPRTTP